MPGAGIEPARGCPQGIFVPTTAFAAARTAARIWGLDFTFTVPVARCELPGQVGAVKSLHFPRGRSERRGLSSVLQPPSRAAGSPTLTPFTPGVSDLGAQLLKSLASTDFATRAWEASRAILLKKRRSSGRRGGRPRTWSYGAKSLILRH